RPQRDFLKPRQNPNRQRVDTNPRLEGGPKNSSSRRKFFGDGSKLRQTTPPRNLLHAVRKFRPSLKGRVDSSLSDALPQRYRIQSARRNSDVGADVPQFRVEAQAERLLQIGDARGAAGSRLGA